jgi:hypothetical protein
MPRQETVLEWLTNFFQTDGDLEQVDINSIKDFSLLWNAFEGTFANRRFSIANIEQRINQRVFDQANYNEFLIYFQNRYIENGQTNDRFPHLNFRPNDRENLVRDVLLGNNQNIHSIILAIIIIVYRYRNNLFHGEKDIRRIRFQRDNFYQSNQFLMQLMENL